MRHMVEGALALALGFMIAILSISCSPYAAAWRTMDATMTARDATASSLAAWAKAEQVTCQAKPVADQRACLDRPAEVLAEWRTKARPAINSALQLTAGAVRLAEMGKDKTTDWMAMLKPAVCALSRAARAWGHYYPDAGKAVLGYLAAVEGVTCE